MQCHIFNKDRRMNENKLESGFGWWAIVFLQLYIGIVIYTKAQHKAYSCSFELITAYSLA